MSAPTAVFALARLIPAVRQNSRIRLHITNTKLIRTFSTNIQMKNSQTPQEDNRYNRKFTQANQDVMKNSIITLPNVLTISRIALTPAIGYFIWSGMNTEALYCFAAAAVTDLLDGVLARSLKQQSHLGAILDPVADKLLMTTCFVALYKVGVLPIWLFGSFICRDMGLLIGGVILRYLSFHDGRPSWKEFINFNRYPMPTFKPTLASKCNTLLQCYLILLHLGASQALDIELSDILVTQLITACLTYYSTGQYLARAFLSDPIKHSLKRN